MNMELAVAFLLFTATISIAPGAGNLALVGIASRHGFKAGLPFVAGSVLGVIVVFSGASIGVSALFHQHPEIYTTIKILGVLYLLFMAWSIARNSDSDESKSIHASFSSGVLVQILNPKAWIATLTILTQFVSSNHDYLNQVVIIGAIMITMGVLGMLIWAYFGAVLNKLLQSPKQKRVINRCLGGSLAVAALIMLGIPS